MRYANVMSTIAVFLSLGGVSYAVTTLEDNSVRSRHVVNSSLTTDDVAFSTLVGTDVKNGSLTGADIKDGSLDGRDLFGPLGGVAYFKYNVNAVPLKNSGSTRLVSDTVPKGDYFVTAQVIGEVARGVDVDTTCRVQLGAGDGKDVAYGYDARRMPTSGPSFPPAISIDLSGVIDVTTDTGVLELECFAISGTAAVPMKVINARMTAIQLRDLQIAPQSS